MIAPVELLRARLENVRALSTGGFTARCPCTANHKHGDRHNSLKVDEGKDRQALIHCHTGCQPEQIVAALGLEMKDLFPAPEAETVGKNGHAPRKRIVASYDYRDESGAVLYQAVRYEPKTFAQRTPDGRGGWLWEVGDVRRVLYRTPELAAADPSEWVIVVEGEKDADLLAAVEILATTNAGGAGKWRPEYAEQLRGRRVCIVPDNDDAGEKHAETVARALHGVAADVRILRLPELPPKGDVADWLAAGGSGKELMRLVVFAPSWDTEAGTGKIGARADATQGPPADWSHWPDPPTEAVYGWFGEYLALMAPTTEAPPAFHLAAALTVAGAAIGKRVRTEYASEPLFANLYTVLIGPSGSSRKDTAIKRALSLSWPPQWERQAVSLPYQTVTDVSSAEGLIRSLERGPNTLLYLTELSNLMRNARRKGTSTILPRLIEAFDTPAKLSNLSKGDPQEVTDPYLSIIAATQPGILSTEMGVEDIHSGFANRWLFVPGDRRERKPTPPKLDKSASWRLWKDLNEAVMSYGPGSALHEAGDVQAVWDVWYLKERARTEEEGSMSVRHPVLVRKIALILAVSDTAKQIQLAHVTAAIALVDWMWEQTRRLMADWGVGIDSQLENRVVDVLTRCGPLKKRELQMKTKGRKWSAIEFDRVFRAMVSNQTIGFDTEGKVGLVDD